MKETIAWTLKDADEIKENNKLIKHLQKYPFQVVEKRSIYEEMKALGIPIGNHYSDLYVLATPESEAVLKRHKEHSYSMFKSRIDGEMYFDIPFAYEPYWEKRQKNS